MDELLPGTVLYDKAGVQFFDGPRRREAAGCHCGANGPPKAKGSRRNVEAPECLACHDDRSARLPIKITIVS